MIHYSCDRCRCQIDAEDELRYVVRIEVQAKMGSESSGDEDESDRDHLLEIHQILERADDEADPLVSEDIYQRRRFDLCGDCYRAFVGNPLGIEVNKQMNFSDN